MACVFYAVAGAMSLLGMWVGFFAGVYFTELYKLVKPHLTRKGKS